MSRRKDQALMRGYNQFGLDTMPHLPPAPGSYRAEVMEALASTGGKLVEPANWDTGRVELTFDLPSLPTGPWNKKLTCGHIVRDNCGGCGQYL